MEPKNKKIPYVLIGMLIIVIFVWYFKTGNDAVAPNPTSSPNATSTVVNIEGVGNVEFEGTGEPVITITRIPQPVPNLDVKISFNNPSLSESVKATLTSNITKLVGELKKDPSSYNNWMNLGMQWKIGGNYENARNYWEYAAKLAPDSATAFINLGDLYAYYLKDNKLAEARFLTALKNAPAEIDVYFRLIDFYSDVVENKTKAKEMLKKGLERFPGNPDLLKYEAALK